MKANYIVKVEDAKLPAIQKALKDAGIIVTSVQEVWKEGGSDSAQAEA